MKQTWDFECHQFFCQERILVTERGHQIVPVVINIIIQFGLQKAFDVDLNFNYSWPYRGPRCLEGKCLSVRWLPSLSFKFSPGRCFARVVIISNLKKGNIFLSFITQCSILQRIKYKAETFFRVFAPWYLYQMVTQKQVRTQGKVLVFFTWLRH